MLHLSEISCGVRQFSDFYDFNNPADIILEVFRAHPARSRDEAQTLTWQEVEQAEQFYGGEHGLGASCVRPAFIIFSNTTKSARTKALLSYIQDHELGTCWSSESKENPNSGNNIKVHVWGVNWRAMGTWAKTHAKAQCGNTDHDEEAA